MGKDTRRYIRVLNVDILDIQERTLLERLHSGVLVTPNLDHLCKLQKDYEFYQCYQRAEWIICDSRVLYFASKILKRRIPESISGSSFFTHYYEYHKNNPNCRIFLLGALDGVANEARRRINEKVGRNIVVGAYSPSYGFERNEGENQKIAQLINESGANVVVVGVGAPKQEKWIMSHKANMPKVDLWMALGATIDFEAGSKRRAPIWIQTLALEWLYRLCSEPKRMFKRYFGDDLVFFWYFLLFRFGLYRNPFDQQG